jgi:6-phosphogluconate dehydrogenase-like protein
MRCVGNPPGSVSRFRLTFLKGCRTRPSGADNTPGFKYIAESFLCRRLWHCKCYLDHQGDNVMSMPVNILDKRTVQLGFIGLGLMGSRLTRRLHSAGWNVQAWNRSPEPADVLRREGVVIATSVAELVVGSDVVLSSLANDEAVYSVYFAPGGVFSAAKRGTIILEMSTISPELSRLLHQQASATALASSIWRSPGQRRRSRRGPSHCSVVVIRRRLSNALPSTSPSRSSGS